MKKVLIFLLLNAWVLSGFSQEKPTPKPSKGYINQTEVGILLGRAEALNSFAATGLSKTNFTAQSFNGYRFNKYFSAGATVGVDWYNAYQILPIQAGLRLDLPSKKKVSSYFGLDAGYGFMWLQKDQTGTGYTSKGGFTMNPTVGLKINLGDDTFLTFSIGYKYQKASDRYVGDFDYIADKSYEYNRLSVRTGIVF